MRARAQKTLRAFLKDPFFSRRAAGRGGQESAGGPPRQALQGAPESRQLKDALASKKEREEDFANLHRTTPQEREEYFAQFDR